MKSMKSNRPQNLNPEALIQSRKEVALQNEEAVRVTVQAIRKRKTPPHKVTVQMVAKESGVSVATIYRRDELFALIQRMNPKLQRRQIEQKQCDTLNQEQEQQIAYYKSQLQLVKTGVQRVQQENTLLRKKILELQRQRQYEKPSGAN